MTVSKIFILYFDNSYLFLYLSWLYHFLFLDVTLIHVRCLWVNSLLHGLIFRTDLCYIEEVRICTEIRTNGLE